MVQLDAARYLTRKAIMLILAGCLFGMALRSCQESYAKPIINGGKIPVDQVEETVYKDINNSTGENLVNVEVTTPSVGAITVTTYSSGFKIGIPASQILYWHEYNTLYRRIYLLNGVILNVSDSFDTIRIKLQNVGWAVN